MTKPSYENRLRELAADLVTPDRFGDVALEDTVEFTLPDWTLFDTDPEQE